MRYYKAVEGTETFEIYGRGLVPAWKVAEKGFPRDEVEWLTAGELAEAIRGDYSDDMDAYADLCDMAGMSEEWESCGDGWCEIIEKAAEKLGVKVD